MAASVDEAAQYAAFVKDTMSQVHAGLELDHTDKKAKVATALKANVLDPDMSPAERVLLGRFALGADDSAYLQTGLATLWSTAPDANGGDGLALSPPGLYTPDAVDGIRAGLLRAMKSKNKLLERQSPAQLDALAPALRLLFSISTLRTAVLVKTPALTDPALTALLGLKWSEQRAELEKLLRENNPNATAKTTELAGNLKTMRDVLAHLHDHLRGASGKGNGQTLTELILEAVQKQAKAIKGLEDTNQKLQKANAGLKASLKKVKLDLLAEKSENVKAMATIATQKARIRELEEENAELEKLRAKCAAELQAATDAVEAAKKLALSWEGLHIALKVKYDALELERDGLLKRVISAEAKSAELDAEIQKKDGEIAVQAEAIERHRKMQGDLAAQVKRLTEQTEAYEKQEKVAAKQLSEASAKFRLEQGKNESLQEALRRAEAATKTAEEQKRKTEAAAAKCDEDLRECRRLKDALEKLQRSTATEATEAEAKLKQQLAEAKRQAEARQAALFEETKELKERLDTNAQQRDKLFAELKTDALEDSTLWKTVIQSHLDAAGPDEKARAERARKLVNELSVFALKTMLDTALGDYVIKSMFSTPETVAQDSSVRGQVEAADRTQLDESCERLQAMVRNDVSKIGNEALRKELKSSGSAASKALQSLCVNLQLWKLYAPRSEGESELLVLPIGVPATEEETPFCFIPLADDIGSALKSNASDVKQMGELLTWMYNLPTTTKSGDKTGEWMLEVDESATPFYYLRFSLVDTALGDGVATQVGLSLIHI